MLIRLIARSMITVSHVRANVCTRLTSFTTRRTTVTNQIPRRSPTMSQLCALPDDTDIRDKRHNCPDYKDIVEYPKNGSLPNDDNVACKITIESDQYTLLDDTLYHLYTPRHKRKDKVYPVVQQLCLPRTLRDSIAQAYHDNNSHIGFDKLYESCLLYTSPSPRDRTRSRMPSSA